MNTMENEQKDKITIRFLKKVDKKAENECWNWKAAIQSNGYGCISVEGVIKLAHRVAYELINGDIPEGLQVLHSCDNRRCVNPRHLYLGTHEDNMRDMLERHRQADGERNGGAKLTCAEVKSIRLLYLDGKYTYKDLGNMFGISSRYVGNIVRGEYWRLPLAE